MLKKIFRNSSYLLISQSFEKGISFFYTIFLAQVLGVEGYGLYIVALSYFSLISGISDFGFSRFLIREVAKNEQHLKAIFTPILILRLTLLAVLFAILASGIYLLDPDKLRGSLVILAILAVLPQSVALTFDGVYIALQKLYWSAIGLLVLRLATVFSGIWLVHLGFGVIGAVSALLIGEMLHVIFMLLLALRYKLSFTHNFPVVLIGKIILGSLPYGLIGILGLIYFKIDSLLLSYLKGSYETGLYGAAYKFLEAIVFIPSAVATALFPVLAKMHETDLSKVKHYYFRSLQILGILSLFIVGAYLFFLPQFITAFLPKFIPSISAIKILALTIPFMFIHIPGAMVLISSDKYLRPVLLLSIGTMAFNVVLNLMLIPQLGYIGSSWATVVSEIVTFLVFFGYLKTKVFKPH